MTRCHTVSLIPHQWHHQLAQRMQCSTIKSSCRDSVLLTRSRRTDSLIRLTSCEPITQQEAVVQASPSNCSNQSCQPRPLCSQRWDLPIPPSLRDLQLSLEEVLSLQMPQTRSMVRIIWAWETSQLILRPSKTRTCSITTSTTTWPKRPMLVLYKKRMRKIS